MWRWCKMDSNKRKQMLINNGHDWYVVTKINGKLKLAHRTELSAILDCEQAMEKFEIAEIEQCWNGEDLEPSE